MYKADGSSSFLKPSEVIASLFMSSLVIVEMVFGECSIIPTAALFKMSLGVREGLDKMVPLPID